MLPLLAACGSEARESVDPFGPGYSSDWIPEPELPSSVTIGATCSRYPCVEVCGQRIAVAPVEPAFGFTDAGSVPWQLGRGNELSGGRLLTVNGLDAEIRDATDLTLLGRTPVPSASRSAALADVALVQGAAARWRCSM